jgi:hypothetical protein
VREPWHSGDMRSVYEAAGGSEGLLRLAGAWHSRVMADEIVSHAFSHGFHPQHNERLAAYWAEALGGPTRIHAGDRRVQPERGIGASGELVDRWSPSTSLPDDGEPQTGDRRVLGQAIAGAGVKDPHVHRL